MNTEFVTLSTYKRFGLLIGVVKITLLIHQNMDRAIKDRKIGYSETNKKRLGSLLVEKNRICLAAS